MYTMKASKTNTPTLDLDKNNANFEKYSRFQNRQLMKNGVDHLAAGRFEEARRDLTTAKDKYSAERWWSIVAQIIKQLIICCFRQGDIHGFIDCSLQLLSPKLGNAVNDHERLQIFQSMMNAWIKPNEFAQQFQNSSILPSYSITLDRIRALFHCGVRFSSSVAVVKDILTVEVKMESYFPTTLKISKVKLCFIDEAYNKTIFHDENETSTELTPSNDDDDMYMNLNFEPNTVKSFIFDITVLDGRNVVQCHEFRLHLSSSDYSSSQDPATRELILVVPSGRMSSATRRNSLCGSEGIVPGMGQGSGSPSFNKKMQFKDTDISGFSLDDGASADGTYVLVRHPLANAEISMVSQPILLVGDIRELDITIQSKEDSMNGAKLSIRCDTSSGEANSDQQDTFIYEKSLDNSSWCPLEVDTSFQPIKAFDLPNLEENSATTFRLGILAHSTAMRRLTIYLTYSNSREIVVQADKRFELFCLEPFKFSFGFQSDSPCHMELLGESTAEVNTQCSVDEKITISTRITSTSSETLEIQSIEFIKNSELQCEDLECRGFICSDLSDNFVQTMGDGDQHTVNINMIPKAIYDNICFGKIEIKWKRLQRDDSDSIQSNFVTTTKFLPVVMTRSPPFVIRTELPAYGVVGESFLMKTIIQNKTNICQDISFSFNNQSDQFLSSGIIKCNLTLQPFEIYNHQIYLVPINCGHHGIPPMEILSRPKNVTLLSKDFTQSIFIKPSHKIKQISHDSPLLF